MAMGCLFFAAILRPCGSTGVIVLITLAVPHHVRCSEV